MKMTATLDPFSSRGFGASAPWLDLANSELYDGFGNFTECLDDGRWVRSFLHYWKLHIPADDRGALNALRELRALLRRLVEKNSAQGTLDSLDIAKLNASIKLPVFPKLVESQSGLALTLQPVQNGWRAEVASVARNFVDSLLREPRGHLKICANKDCRWIFVDRTKGNVRRWCSDATCGNRDRVRRSRAINLGGKL
jgi:predicted RNA-binding Zn ribbon-like protein